MDLTDLLKIGASLIQNNDDEKTTGIDTDTITNALSSLFGSKDGNGLDLSSVISAVTSGGGLSEIVSSWVGNGENAPIDPDQVSELVGDDKVNEFAEKLGVDVDSAKKALADALPNVVDQATNEDSSLVGDLLEKVGGVQGAMDMLSGFLKKS